MIESINEIDNKLKRTYKSNKREQKPESDKKKLKLSDLNKDLENDNKINDLAN